MKELEEEKTRLQKTSAAQHTQLDKYKKLSEDRQSLADSLETQVSALKKVWVRHLSLQFLDPESGSQKASLVVVLVVVVISSLKNP